MDEVEILRGANVRVTTGTVQVGNTLTPIPAIREVAFVEADHKLKLIPKILLVAGPIAGGGIYLLMNSFVTGALAGALMMLIGAVLYRDSWLHHVTVRSADGVSKTLYRTSRKGDALLFHAAIQKALEMRPG